jgi:small subunit ribosomal protein S17
MADEQPVEQTEPGAEAPATSAAADTMKAHGQDRAGTAAGPRPNARKVREGLVVSDRMEGTVVVAVVERVRHARYGKTVQRTKKLYVNDTENAAKLGDRVRVVETRPTSKLKRWRLSEVLERAR